jgi:hypothetical protein
MIKLYWGNLEDGYKEIGECIDQKELNLLIMDYLNLLNFKSYYSRGWETEDGFTMCDYGSHVNFFKYKEERA